MEDLRNRLKDCPNCEGIGYVECKADHGGGHPTECGESIRCCVCKGFGMVKNE